MSKNGVTNYEKCVRQEVREVDVSGEISDFKCNISQ